MNVVALGESIGAAGAQAALITNVSPFLQGGPAEAEIVVSPDFNGTVDIEVSDDDGVTWNAASLTVTGTNQPNKKASITLGTQVRMNVTAWTAGLCSAYLRG